MSASYSKKFEKKFAKADIENAIAPTNIYNERMNELNGRYGADSIKTFQIPDWYRDMVDSTNVVYKGNKKVIDENINRETNTVIKMIVSMLIANPNDLNITNKYTEMLAQFMMLTNTYKEKKNINFLFKIFRKIDKHFNR